MNVKTLSRREFLTNVAFSTTVILASPGLLAANQTNRSNSAPALARTSRYRIAVCDWMILKRQKLGAFQLTKDIGADGVEVDMGGLGDRETFDNQLANADVRQQFLEKSRELGVEICSLAMSGF